MCNEEVQGSEYEEKMDLICSKKSDELAPHFLKPLIQIVDIPICQESKIKRNSNQKECLLVEILAQAEISILSRSSSSPRSTRKGSGRKRRNNAKSKGETVPDNAVRDIRSKMSFLLKQKPFIAVHKLQAAGLLNMTDDGIA
jgi:hypothetical protein